MDFTTIIQENNNDKDSELRICFLDIGVFLNYSFLLELNISGNNLNYIPLSISQCFLLEKIDISYNNIAIPPPVLFSLPNIRKNPENLIYGDNIRCTQKIVQYTLCNVSKMNQLIIKFHKPHDRATYTISVAPDTTLRELFVLLYPDLSIFYDYVILTRTVQNSNQVTLYLNINELPIGVYYYPNAIWSVELKYCPPLLNKSLIPLLKQYIIQQSITFGDDSALNMCKELLLSQNEINDDFILTIEGIIKKSRYITYRHFIIETQSEEKLEIGISVDNVSIQPQNSQSHYIFKHSDIGFDCINKMLILYVGTKAIKISRNSSSELLKLLAIVLSSQGFIPDNDDISLGSNIADVELSLSSIYSHEAITIIPDDKVDDLLQSLREFKGELVNFERNK